MPTVPDYIEDHYPEILISAAFLILISLSLYTNNMGSDENIESDGFVDVTESIEDNPSLRRYGLATVEVSGEKRVFVTGYGGPNALMRWDDGKLISDTPEQLKDPDTNAIGAAGCDIDADGQEEIYVLTTGNQFGGQKATKDRLYDLQDGEWVDLLKDSDVTNQYSGRSVACHYSPEGYSFFVARYQGPMQLITDADEGLRDLAEKYEMDRITGGRSLVNLPGKNGVDLFVGNERGPNFYFRQNEEGYEEVAKELGVADRYLPARGATVYDKDGDGDLDLAIANWNAENKLYEKTESGFKDSTLDDFATRGPARSLVAAEFNNLDTSIYLNKIASNRRAPNQLFDSQGNEIQVGEASEPNGLGTGATVVDIDSDGILELIIAHGETGSQPLTMYKVPNQEEYLRVKPLWKSGAPARNSLVKYEGKVYPVDGGSGYLNQMEPWAHIGNVSKPAEVTVIFPDGKTVEKEVRSETVKINYPE